MAEVSPPISKHEMVDDLPRPIGVMPNWAYGKTQFNDLDIYKKIEPMLKADPVAMLGWQSYTTGNLEIRSMDSESTNMSTPGAFQSSRNQKFLLQPDVQEAPTGRSSMNKMLERQKQAAKQGDVKLKIPRKFKSSSNVDKILHTVYSGNKNLAGEEETTLIHELRHAGLEFLTKRTGEERTIKDYSIEAFQHIHDLKDEEGVFAILDRAMLKNFFPKTGSKPAAARQEGIDTYDKRKSARKEIDNRVAKLNTLATQELNAIKNTSISERLKQKSLGGDDKSTIKKVMDWIFSQKQPDNLDTQMKALKVG